LVLAPKYAALSAAWYWNKRGLNKEADAKDYTAMTKKINGGVIGLDDRIKHIKHALEVLGG
jgi:putative chitinase